MQLGMVGLGRMGASMTTRLMAGGHEVVGFDLHVERVQALASRGAGSVRSLEELAAALKPPRSIWLMLPAAVVDDTIAALGPLLARDDVIIDGGNSYYRDDLRRAATLAAAGIHYVDAEGLNILRHADVGKRARAGDAETAPLRHPELYQYDFDLAAVAEVWRRGSVIASWLLDLTAEALLGDPELARFAGRVSDSGEGRWTLDAAIDESVPAPILSTAIGERFASRGEADFADRILSAMRFQFGGHQEK